MVEVGGRYSLAGSPGILPWAEDGAEKSLQC
jgi:hypothetical protein